MQGRKLIWITVFIAILAAGWAGWSWWRGRHAIDPGDPAQVAMGQAVYQAHCAQCHGAKLEGEPDWRIRRPTGELPAPPHDESGHTWHHADEYLFGVTKHGLARYAPPDYKTAMPSFVGILSDAQIRAVIAYIKSTWPDHIRARQAELSRR